MSRFAAGGLTGAGSTTLPLASLYGGGASSPLAQIREIGIFNTTATAVALKLVRLTTTGTQGTNLTEAALRATDPVAAAATAWLTHTVAPTLGNDLGFRTVLGAAIGSGVIWTFDENDLVIPATANAGVGIIVENGTGQACQAYFKWAE